MDFNNELTNNCRRTSSPNEDGRETPLLRGTLKSSQYPLNKSLQNPQESLFNLISQILRYKGNGLALPHASLPIRAISSTIRNRFHANTTLRRGRFARLGRICCGSASCDDKSADMQRGSESVCTRAPGQTQSSSERASCTQLSDTNHSQTPISDRN